jgi:hypothetical protein
MATESKQPGRRVVLKLAGLIAAGGVPLAVAAVKEGARRGTRKRAWWAKTVNQPTLGGRGPRLQALLGRQHACDLPGVEDPVRRSGRV